jgi:GTP cyclohydrolase I
MVIVDNESLQRAVSEILVAVGEDPTREGLQGTPARVAELIQDLYSGVGVDPVSVLQEARPVDTTEGERGEMVALRDIAFHSLCEHHLLPFEGFASVVYAPAERIIGLGTIAQLVEVVARRPQLQERVGEMIVRSLVESGVAAGALAVVSAVHGCVAYRGPRQKLTTVTVASVGTLASGEAKHQALLLAGGEDWE